MSRTVLGLAVCIVLIGSVAVQAVADDPETATNAFFEAVYAVTHGNAQDGKAKLGRVMVTANWENTHPVLASALKETPWVFDSYAQGTSPSNGYASVDPSGFELDIAGVEMIATDLFGIGELAKVSLVSTGADAPRPLYLRQVGGNWKVANASSLCAGVKAADGNPGNDIAATAKPEGVVHLFLEAIYLYALGDRKEGEYLLRSALPTDPNPNSLKRCLDTARDKPWIFYSYATGTSVDEGYTNFDPFDFEVRITRQEKVGEDIKAFIASTGADTPRPFRSSVTKRGQLRMVEYSSLYVEVRPPKKEAW